MRVAIIGRTEALYDTARHLLARGFSIPLIITCKEAPEYKVKSDDFEKLKTSNSRVNAWKKGEVLFLLTDLTVHGIDPISVRHGPGGFAAYEIAYLPSILFTNDNGTPISVYFQKDNSKYEY